MTKIESKLVFDSITGFTQLNQLYFLLSLWRGCVLQTLQFAEHLHVALELEFAGFDEFFLSVSDSLEIVVCTNIVVCFLDTFTCLFVIQVSLVRSVEVFLRKLNPFTRFDCHVDNTLFVQLLT